MIRKFTSIILPISIAVFLFISGCANRSFPEDFDFGTNEQPLIILDVGTDDKVYLGSQGIQKLSERHMGKIIDQSGVSFNACFGNEYSCSTNLIFNLNAKLTNRVYTVQGTVDCSQTAILIFEGTAEETSQVKRIALTNGTNTIDFSGELFFKFEHVFEWY